MARWHWVAAWLEQVEVTAKKSGQVLMDRATRHITEHGGWGEVSGWLRESVPVPQQSRVKIKLNNQSFMNESCLLQSYPLKE